MEFNHKNLKNTTKLIYYSISAILGLFLILLSGNIIDDLATTTTAPQLADYEQSKAQVLLQQQQKKATQKLENLQTQLATYQKTIALAKNNYSHEKESFENWLATRKTLGLPSKDLEVLSRAKKLDEFYAVEQAWQTKVSEIQQQQAQTEKQIALIDEQLLGVATTAERQYQAALTQYELQVFLIRLLFVAPILALGIYFFIRYRKHQFWPLFMGFTFFSLYAFFFGLVPYLPSYGGYIRYSVGIALSIGLGYYAIKKIQNYMTAQEAALKNSSQDRAKKLSVSLAERALEQHLCPSCGKDFILKKWEMPLTNFKDSEQFKLVSNYCRHCGLSLFSDCHTCGHTNFVHLPYCASCGTTIKDDKS